MSEWISVKDRLPELNKNVLVYGGTENHPCKYNEMTESYFYKMSNCGIIKCAKEDMYWKVSHWMPLPEPPK